MPLEIVHMLRIETNPVYRRTIALILLAFPITLVRAQTVVGIRGTQFTINGQTTYSAASGFPAASPSLEGTLLNVRAVQAIFDDAHYPTQGSKEHPYLSSVASPVSFDYPNGPYGAAQNLDEFLAALPTWRRAGVLAFTVNLQGGGPSDGNFGVHDQPHLNSGFDPHGNLKSAYAQRLTRVIERADQLGMVVIVGYFYQGSEHWIDEAPDDKYMREAVRQASLFLKGLPHRNMMIEIANEVSPTMYRHPLLQSNGILDAVNLAKESVQHQIPVSFSWIGVPPPRGSRANDALRAVDYVLTHTNHRSAEGVHQYIQAMRAAVGYDRPVLINEDGISSFNLQAAIEEHAGWGYYDQGLNNACGNNGSLCPPSTNIRKDLALDGTGNTYAKVGLTNNPLSIILPSAVSPFGVYLMRVYAERAIPFEIIEAARMDGAGELRIFRSIALRTLMPGFVTVALFAFVACWNNYFLPLIMLSEPKWYPLTVGLQQWNSQATAGGGATSAFNIVITGSLISIIPLILAFVFLQRYWQSGLGSGGVKG